jgi:hypothetical protein
MIAAGAPNASPQAEPMSGTIPCGTFRSHLTIVQSLVDYYFVERGYINRLVRRKPYARKE